MAWRYLFSKSQQSVVNLITYVTLLVIVVASAALLVVRGALETDAAAGVTAVLADVAIRAGVLAGFRFLALRYVDEAVDSIHLHKRHRVLLCGRLTRVRRASSGHG